MEMLTVKEVASIKGCSERYIKKIIATGKLVAEETFNERNRKKYLVPVSALDTTLQRKYYNQKKQQNPISTATGIPVRAESKPLDHYSAKERDQIAFWIDTLEKWQQYRNDPRVHSKVEVDQHFISAMKLENPDLKISTHILYRKWKGYKVGDLDVLIEKRCKHRKGKSKIHPQIWDYFMSYYLDQAQYSIPKCVEFARILARHECPELLDGIPHQSTFYRRVDSDVPEPVKTYGRQGKKAYEDKRGWYIRREYENMRSNEYWIADNHTFDVQTRGENGRLHRLHLSAFMDARSGMFVSWEIVETSTSDATVLALRKGIQKHGIPDWIYVDNGREYLTLDVGGLGHRAKKTKAGEKKFTPPPIFERLGIKMVNAIVKNARAKTIERRFRDVKDDISKLFETYTGGHVLERPERLSSIVKRPEKVIADNDFKQKINDLLEYYMNYQPYNGDVKADKGKKRIDVYNEQLLEVRRAPEEELNLMLMRSTRPKKIGRLGVSLKVSSQQYDYNNKDLHMLQGDEVYLRYDPSDLSEVRIYDLEDRFLMTAQCTNELIGTYGMSKEQIKKSMQYQRQMEREVRKKVDIYRNPACGRKEALDVIMLQVQQNKEQGIVAPPDPKVIELQRCIEEPLYQQAVGAELDLDRMNKNAALNQIENEEGDY